MSASPSLRIALAINRGVFAAELKFFENIWRGGAELWVDVGSKSAKFGYLYWIRGEEDNRRGGKNRDRGGSERVRVRDRRKAVIVVKPHKTCGGSKFNVPGSREEQPAGGTSTFREFPKRRNDRRLQWRPTTASRRRDRFTFIPNHLPAVFALVSVSHC
jgi:hypothetical protein